MSINPSATWHAEHQRFAWLLRYLDGQLAALREEKEPDYALLRDVVHYLHHVAGASHHPREDVVFRLLAWRDPSLAIPLSRLLQEHRVLDVAGEELLKLVESVLEDVIVEREQLEAAAATYLVYYHHHLESEEREIVPRAAELLTAADWAAVEAAAPQSAGDPLLGPGAGPAYRDLRRRIEGEATRI